MTMRAIPVAAYTLTNACGSGQDEVWRALRAETSGLRPNDFAPAAGLDTWIGRVADLEQCSLPASLARFDCRNHRLALAGLDQDGFAAAVRAASARHGKHRIGVFVGTSTSGILARVIGDEARAAMKECLKNIQNGNYAKQFILEGRTNYPEMVARRRLNAAHPIEQVGGQLRAMMPWIAKNKLVDQSKN